MDNTRLSQTNNFLQSVSDITESLRMNNIPANRIFDTIMTQMSELEEQINAKRGKRASVSDIEEIEEKMEILETLSDVYLKQIQDNYDYRKKATKQIDAVEKTLEFVEDYKDSIQRYKGILKRNEKDLGNEEEAPAFEKIASLIERTDFVQNLIKKSSESAVTSLKMMQDLLENGKTPYTEEEKNSLRYGMASVAIAERVLLGGEEIQDLRTRIRRAGEFEKMVSTVAESKSFVTVTEDKLNPEGIRKFLKEADSGKKLWKSFERKAKENQKGGKTKELSGKAPAKTNGKKLEKKMKPLDELKAEKKELKKEQEKKKQKEMKKEIKPRTPGM